MELTSKTARVSVKSISKDEKYQEEFTLGQKVLWLAFGLIVVYFLGQLFGGAF